MKGNRANSSITRKLKVTLLFMFMGVAGLFAQTTITGTITDTEAIPLIGVNILEKGTTNGTITDLDGVYSITVQGSEAILEFKYIGFKAQEIQVGNRTNLDVVLEEDLMALDEVVVVAYGVQKKSQVTGAVSSL